MKSDDDEESDSSGVPPLELAKSYLAYVLRALRLRKKPALIIGSALLALTALVVAVWPRTYSCVTMIAASDNSVLSGEKSTEVIRGAAEVIGSHENVAHIVDEVGLVKSWEASLPPVSRFKQAVMTRLRGPLSDQDKRDALIALVEARLSVTPPGWMESKLIVTVDWHDPYMAAKLADAADQSFLQARHVAEISTISEYISILDGHATQLRAEIQSLGDQAQSARDDKLAKTQQREAANAEEKPTKSAPRAAAASSPTKSSEPTEDLSDLKAALDAKQRALKDLEDQRQRRIADAEARLTELRSQFTPAHPMVVAAENNIAALSADTAQLSALRSETSALEATLKSKSAARELAAQGGPKVSSVPPSSGTPGASGVEPLPAEIMRLMREDDQELDPAVAAQFRTAVAKYATLRDKIGTARVDLDTAQAAFKHRYQIVTPAEPPASPSKPKVPLLLAAGVLLSLLLAVLAAVIAELKTGRIVESWQVHQLGVPLLADLGWPPSDP